MPVLRFYEEHACTYMYNYLSLGACARVTVVVLCVSVCVCCRTSSYMYIPVQSEALYSFLKAFTDTCVCIVWTLLKMFRSRVMAVFTWHDDQRLGSFSTKKHTIGS